MGTGCRGESWIHAGLIGDRSSAGGTGPRGTTDTAPPGRARHGGSQSTGEFHGRDHQRHREIHSPNLQLVSVAREPPRLLKRAGFDTGNCENESHKGMTFISSGEAPEEPSLTLATFIQSFLGKYKLLC